MKAVVLDGKVINIGAWDACPDEDGNETNPMPQGAVFGEFDISMVDGRYVLAEDYQAMRAAAYPPIEDQLDMLYHDHLDGTTTWADAIRDVKERHPKEGA